MNRIKTFLLLMIAAAIHCNAAKYLRVNQLGYRVAAEKVAEIMRARGGAPTWYGLGLNTLLRQGQIALLSESPTMPIPEHRRCR